MEGMVYKLTPIKGQQVNLDQLHDNLMNVYNWSNMNKSGVLVDYYTRRHTSQYRHYFFILAEQYAREYENQSKVLASLERFEGDEAAGVENYTEKVADAKAKRDAAKDKTIEVIKYAMEVMPLNNVIDYGEPNSSKQPLPEGSGIDFIYTYDDGKAHEFARVLYIVGANEEAVKIALDVADELESIMNFSLDEKPSIASETEVDFFAALDSYLNMYTVAAELQTQDAFTQRAERYLSELKERYKEMIHRMGEEDKGRDRADRVYNNTIRSFNDRIMRMGLVHGVEL